MRRYFSLLVNRLIAAAVLIVWTRLSLRFSEAGLPVGAVPGSANYLKYFTVLSNLLMGLAAGMYAVALQLKLCGAIRRLPGWLRRFKYMAACALGLTFFTVLLFLGPRTGFRDSYDGPNLWFHLILPLAALIDFALLDREGRIARRELPLALPLPALYGVFYLGNLIRNGYGGPDHPNDWYGFAEGGPAGAFIAFAILLAISLAVAALLWLPRRRRPADGA